jgi:hypothetical protein
LVLNFLGDGGEGTAVGVDQKRRLRVRKFSWRSSEDEDFAAREAEGAQQKREKRTVQGATAGAVRMNGRAPDPSRISRF